MIRLAEITELRGGSPQFRIVESSSDNAPAYPLYGQAELENDLAGISIHNSAAGEHSKLIRTKDQVSTLEAGDLIFSLVSGKATIVGPRHKGYLFTQNYVKLIPSKPVNTKYLAYILNMSDDIKRQLQNGLQGTATLKHTIGQLANLQFAALPPIEAQRIAGELYFNQLKLEALKKRQATLETKLVIGKMKGANLQ